MTKSKQTDSYVVRVGDAQVGPVSLDQLKRGVQAGKIPVNAEAKAEGTHDWKPVSEVAMRKVLPLPRPPPKPMRAEPSWSAFQAPTENFSRPLYLVFIPGSTEPPSGPYKAADLRARMESGAAPPNAMVCVVNEDACWIPIGNVLSK